LFAERVLIDGDCFLVEEDAFVIGGHLAEIVASEQRRGEESPEAHVGSILLGGHVAVTDFEHVGIVPVAGSGEGSEISLLEADDGHSTVGVVNVVGGSPHLRSDLRAPLPGFSDAVLAEAVEDRPVGGFESVAHLAVGVDHHLEGGIGVAVVFCSELAHRILHGAEVVLEEVDAPAGVHLSVLNFVAEAAFVASTGLWSGRGVDAELEALGVDVVAERLHVGEAAVGMELSVGVAGALPGVVDVDVDVAGVAHAGGDHEIGCGTNVGVGDVFCEVIPAIPAHWRSGG